MKNGVPIDSSGDLLDPRVNCEDYVHPTDGNYKDLILTKFDDHERDV